ncbi:Thioredoxin-like [Arachidicoccus rhizosphaerae]|uniref:Thioredoxin-like n=1 Tax=Arachidicoccus rhizosphaerae TaxID=551991 RepID=A0A1H4BXH3_9BACT|nr:thioredoxin family protein [Arachidicoccus rhizosphaerae]SEA52542.1 Thioredoxin-like [Arachidicoccus rhizosphaerae]
MKKTTTRNTLILSLLIVAASLTTPKLCQSQQAAPPVAHITQAPASAKQIMEAAKAKASAEHKNVMIIFHASWCGWCKKMDASIQDPSCKDYFEKNYVIEHLTVMEHGANAALENPGAEQMLEEYGGGESGIPYWLIFSPDGKLLADSKFHSDDPANEANGQNMGCPAQTTEVDYFISVLKKTSQMSDSEAAAVKARFLKNNPSKS